MRTGAQCYQCLERLVWQTVDLATVEEELRTRALQKGIETLQKIFSPDKIPTQIAGEVQRVIRQTTGNKNPYRIIKDRELEMGKRLYQAARPHYGDDLRSLITLSILGNAMDFFRGADVVARITAQPVVFTIDDIARFEERLSKAKKILLLADNAGECFFDLPLLIKLGNTAEVLYVVKEAPVQDDLTWEELHLTGLEKDIKRIITTGTDTPGLDLALASPEFKQEFVSADLVVAKGMGYYETLSEFAPLGRFFHLLMAKCHPVAVSLGVPLNSYIAMLR